MSSFAMLSEPDGDRQAVSVPRRWVGLGPGEASHMPLRDKRAGQRIEKIVAASPAWRRARHQFGRYALARKQPASGRGAFIALLGMGQRRAGQPREDHFRMGFEHPSGEGRIVTEQFIQLADFWKDVEGLFCHRAWWIRAGPCRAA